MYKNNNISTSSGIQIIEVTKKRVQSVLILQFRSWHTGILIQNLGWICIPIPVPIIEGFVSAFHRAMNKKL